MEGKGHSLWSGTSGAPVPKCGCICVIENVWLCVHVSVCMSVLGIVGVNLCV